MNKVVARFADGHMVKGVTSDFVPTKDRFHVAEASAGPGAKPLEVETKDLKALFFVREFGGNPQHEDRNAFDPAHAIAGRRIKVRFKDGEVLVGTTQGYQPGRPGSSWFRRTRTPTPSAATSFQQRHRRSGSCRRGRSTNGAAEQRDEADEAQGGTRSAS